MNFVSVHNILEISISEVKDLDNAFSKTIYIYQNSEYNNAERDIAFEITLFSKDITNLEIKNQKST